MRQIIVVAVISIHVPLAGNVFPLRRQCWVTEGFLSTFPLRGTSISRKILFYRLQISIHVPIAGNVDRIRAMSDEELAFLSTFPLRGTSRRRLSHIDGRGDFYPRSPCGERRIDRADVIMSLYISIHVPLAGNVSSGSDGHALFAQFLSTFPLRGTSRSCSQNSATTSHFYPRSPCGERPFAGEVVYAVILISIHVPLAGNVRA